MCVTGDYVFTDKRVLERVPYVWLILAGLIFLFMLPGLIFIREDEGEEEGEEEEFPHILSISKGSRDTVDDYEELLSSENGNSKPLLGIVLASRVF